MIDPESHVPALWNKLQTEADLEYAASTLGFRLAIIEVVDHPTCYTLTPTPNYFGDFEVPSLPACTSRDELVAMLLGLHSMHAVLWKVRDKIARDIDAVINPFGR